MHLAREKIPWSAYETKVESLRKYTKEQGIQTTAKPSLRGDSSLIFIGQITLDEVDFHCSWRTGLDAQFTAVALFRIECDLHGLGVNVQGAG